MDRVKDAIAAIRDVAVIGGIVLFTLGYFYREAYFDELGVPTHASLSDIQETILFATTVLALRWWWFVLFGLAVYLSYRLLVYLKAKQKVSDARASQLRIGLIAIALLVFLSLGEHAAEGAGRDVAHDVVTEHDVHFSTFAFEPKKLPQEYVDVLDRDFGASDSHLVLINESADSYFIIKTNPNLARDQRPSAFRIPKTAVRAVHTFPKRSGG